jgi:hypothetical protein
MKKIAKAALLAASILSLPVAAQADQFDYGSFGEINGQNITITSPTSVGVSAGMIVLNGTGPNAGQTLDAWCVDLFDHLQSSAIYNIVPLTNAGAGFPNPILTNQQISELGSLMVHGTTSVLGNTFGLNGSAAFQLAIWNIEYQGSLLDNASGALATLVAQLVANVQPGGVWDCPGCSVELLDAPAQNQVLAFGVPSETPLPAAFWLFGSGLGGAALLMRGRKKAKA